MPRKAESKSVKRVKPRTKTRKTKKFVRRVKKNRRTKVKRRWWRKFKGKHSIYQWPKSMGLKWAQYLNIADFISLPHVLQFPAILQFAEFGQNKTLPNGSKPTPNCIDRCKTIMSRLYAIYSTKSMTSQNSVQEGVFDSADLIWKAWNPYPCHETLGSWFNNAINMYRQYKYVGVQVKWIPNAKYVTSYWEKFRNQSNAPAQNINTMTVTQGTGEGAFDFSQTSSAGQFGVPNCFAQAAGHDNTIGMGYHIPPVFRMWVNFNKQGYATMNPFYEVWIDGVDDGASGQNDLTDSRYLSKAVFDLYDQKQDLGKIKCYDMRKKFKFYVRPKIIYKGGEAPNDYAPMNQYQPVLSSWASGLMNSIPDANQVTTSLKRYPWTQLTYFHPEMYLERNYNTSNINNNQMNQLCAIEALDHAYVDPILFGYLFTCDALDIGKYTIPFQVASTNAGTETAFNPYKNRLYPNEFLENMGRFKVTFYMKFRGVKGNRYIPSVNQSRRNGMLGQWYLNRGYPIIQD